MGDSRAYNYLFVSAPFSGIEVFMKNVQGVWEADDRSHSSWIWLTHRLAFSGPARTLVQRLNWTVKASYYTHLRIRDLERAGNVFDAAFFNHITPYTFLYRFRKRVPAILSLDSTPASMDRFPGHYKKKKTIALPWHSLQFRYHMTRKAYADASFILAWSDFVKRSLIDDYHIPEDTIVVVPPGVDLERFVPVDRSTRDPLRTVKVLFVGGEFIRKGGDILLALAHEERFKHIEFHFVTRSFAGDRGPNVFVYDSISPESNLLQTLYEDADIFAIPTRADFCPTNTICEAMASGLPVISTNVGGLGEIVRDRETGRLIGVDDTDGLADVLGELAGNSGERIRLGKNARRMVEDKFDLRKNSKEILFYLQLAANNGRH